MDDERVEPLEVTTENFGELLLQSVAEAVAIHEQHTREVAMADPLTDEIIARLTPMEIRACAFALQMMHELEPASAKGRDIAKAAASAERKLRILLPADMRPAMRHTPLGDVP